MAYVADNLSLADTQLGGYQPRYWHYTTASDSDATIVGAGYFADGVTKGMKVGDIVDVVATTGPKYKRYQCASVSGAAATVAAPTAIT
ncbi:hypothetical protein EN866_33280 [Mesorhizobium sp. M2D.F.Ca.ET.223.01.1.1]|uniref:hypothetical protein n=1 Tax=Mesorhizobium sp. M2D.F.Ca.ET.223.01.1.1 TaxID=2563940 RepID=UPI001091E047|nr:hypothetical protein [Mesorhizobium sp. M2D.F.Ca.ET.223.01.1.1]TGR84538.1 hypothetical protein EN866_33280 [Mesorhizobium sp. M2D.F.Ca.ET.223.01.1.1]TGT65310.1 hypothetical protein EN802_32035 [bacterium M00.F.Ca.ET.159.01.1.1]TGT79421.1 hypothetical protein EN800_31375 [bacterium M00.F.Ca.ET.157.01.1.1]